LIITQATIFFILHTFFLQFIFVSRGAAFQMTPVAAKTANFAAVMSLSGGQIQGGGTIADMNHAGLKELHARTATGWATVVALVKGNVNGFGSACVSAPKTFVCWSESTEDETSTGLWPKGVTPFFSGKKLDVPFLLVEYN
jgi:putative transposon-encoded protein